MKLWTGGIVGASGWSGASRNISEINLAIGNNVVDSFLATPEVAATWFYVIFNTGLSPTSSLVGHVHAGWAGMVGTSSVYYSAVRDGAYSLGLNRDIQVSVNQVSGAIRLSVYLPSSLPAAGWKFRGTRLAI